VIREFGHHPRIDMGAPFEGVRRQARRRSADARAGRQYVKASLVPRDGKSCVARIVRKRRPGPGSAAGDDIHLHARATHEGRCGGTAEGVGVGSSLSSTPSNANCPGRASMLSRYGRAACAAVQFDEDAPRRVSRHPARWQGTAPAFAHIAPPIIGAQMRPRQDLASTVEMNSHTAGMRERPQGPRSTAP